MIKYLKVSKSHYLNTETLYLTTEAKLKKPNVILEPMYLRGNLNTKSRNITGIDFTNGVMSDIVSRVEPTNEIKLKNMLITEYPNKQILSFYDSRTHLKHRVEFELVSCYINDKGALVYDMILTINGQSSTCKGMKIEDCVNHLRPLLNFSQIKKYKSDKEFCTLNYGLSATLYDIEFKNRKLDGSCYCFIYGLWGILLRDDFSIDALFLVDKTKKQTISAGYFLWTSNPYIGKFILMK